jgi:hypothetical protein
VSSESTPKTVNPAPIINSRLPRPVAAPSINSANPPQLSVSIAATSKEPGGDTSSNDKKSVVSKRNAFEVLMKKPFQTKAKFEGKASLPKGGGAQKSDMKSKASTAGTSRPSIFAKSKGEEKPAAPLNRPILKLRERMRPRPKSKTSKGPLLIPMVDDEEETTADADFGVKDEVAGRGSARESPDPGPSTLVASSMQVEGTQENGHARLGDAEMSVDHRPSESVLVETTPVPTIVDSIASLPADKPVSEINQEGESSQSAQPASVKARPNKSPLGKKRQPTSIAPVSRVTRSVSKQKTQSSEPGISSFILVSCSLVMIFFSVRTKKSAAPASSALKRTASGRVKKSVQPAEQTSTVDTDPEDETPNLPPGSPMKTSSPAKTPPRSHSGMMDDEAQTIDFGAGKLTLAKTPVRAKPASTPSPTKIARATSMFIKPTSKDFVHSA